MVFFFVFFIFVVILNCLECGYQMGLYHLTDSFHPSAPIFTRRIVNQFDLEHSSKGWSNTFFRTMKFPALHLEHFAIVLQKRVETQRKHESPKPWLCLYLLNNVWVERQTKPVRLCLIILLISHRL